MQALARWYRSGGKLGACTFDDLPLLELALEMRVNPAEIENTWSEYHVNRLLAVLEARALARSLR